MGIQIERRFERLTKLAGAAASEKRQALIELRDVLQLFRPVGDDAAKVAADEGLDRLVCGRTFELDAENRAGVPDVNLIANLGVDVDADIFRRTDSRGLRLDRGADIR